MCVLCGLCALASPCSFRGSESKGSVDEVVQGLWLQDCKELLRTALVSGIGVVVEEMETVVLHGGAETAAKMERRRRKRLSKRKTFNTLWCD